MDRGTITGKLPLWETLTFSSVCLSAEQCPLEPGIVHNSHLYTCSHIPQTAAAGLLPLCCAWDRQIVQEKKYVGPRRSLFTERRKKTNVITENLGYAGQIAH